MPPASSIDLPKLSWNGGEPRSERYGDIYFARGQGLAESRYVFLQHTGVMERWRDAQRFVICETGFGTGLNFLATWQAWAAQADPGQTLHYVSIERYPLHADELARALSLWPELADLSGQLVARYPPRLPGWHRVYLHGGRVVLTLVFADVRQALDELQVRADAWFLDGFDPARNPQMWTPEVMRGVARNSGPGTCVATFTAASRVRRALSAAGFRVLKARGFGSKREMLYGYLAVACPEQTPSPWFSLPGAVRGRRVAVIGAGVAGCAVARQLARTGWEVQVLERSGQAGSAASGNPAGAVLPPATADSGPYGRFYRMAFAHAVMQLNDLRESHPEIDWHGEGIVQLAWEARLERRQRAMVEGGDQEGWLGRWLDVPQLSEASGVALPRGGVLYPHGGWVRPPQLCRALLVEAGLGVISATVNGLRYDGGRWQVLAAGGATLAEVDAVVIAAGADCPTLAQSAGLPLVVARGQLSLVPATEASTRLRRGVCYDGYVLPAVDGCHVVGATYGRDDRDLDLRVVEHRTNREHLERHVPALANVLGKQPCGGRVALRATTADQLPLVGGVPDLSAYRRYYSNLRHGAHGRRLPDAPYYPGLYMAAGFGSRGLIGAFLAADYLADVMGGGPSPLPRPVVQALHPARFAVRQLRRGTATGDSA